MRGESLTVFPTLIKVYNIKDHPNEKTVIDKIENYQGKRPHGLISDGESSFENKKLWFLNDKELFGLWETIQQCCESFCKESGLCEPMISASWFNILYKGGRVEAHRHERSIVSGAYFPMVEPSSSPLVFENPLEQYMMGTQIVEETSFSQNFLEFKPANGMMILFPSWLKHHVPENKSGKRYTVSFNTVNKSDIDSYSTINDLRENKK